MPGLAGILGNPMLEQLLLYNVVGQLIGAALGPYLVALTNEVNQATPLVPLSPADMAEAVLRNIVTEAEGASEARFAGVNAERFHQLTLLAGNAPDPTSLAVALRRGLISQDRYLTGIRQGRLRDEWAPLVRELAVQQPSPTAMLQAYLEGQVGEGEARAKYAQLGGDPAYFDILFDSQGQAPTPVQAAEMANRGAIPWTGSGAGVVSFEQAFLEGPWRNKWLAPFRTISRYLPPPRTVTAMHKEGALTDAEAARLLEDQGLTPQLAQAYLHSASRQRTAPSRDLAQSTILELYRDKIIPRPEALAFLQALGYAPDEAEFVVEVEDVRLAAKYTTAAVSRIHSLYTGHKLDQAQAAGALSDLGVDATDATDLLAIWTHERAAVVKHLTAAEIGNALHLALVDQAAAQQLLEAQGYTPHDAWLYLSVHAKARLPAEPPA